MATVLPTGPPQPQPGHMQMDPSLREPIPQLSWEGEKMFNIYIFDYCTKRGFKNTARELMLEAELGSDAAPPINARQGLLFEWWSVFWVLFQARSGNSNQEDASVYIQHLNAQKAAAQRLAPPGQQQQSGPPMPLGNQSQQALSNPQPQPSVNRMSNGMPMQRQAPPYHANGSMPNGISPAMGGQPAQPGQGMQGQPGGPINFGMGGQPNGAQQPPQGPQQPGAQPMQFNPMMGGGGSVQRPPMNGQPQQSGQQQAGRGPFTSPPMAHSPQGGAGGQPAPQGPQPGQPGQQAPMAQLGPSPHMAPLNRTMLPPTGVGAPMNPPTGQAGGHQNPAFALGPGPTQGQQGSTSGRPPSRTKPSPSPSMSARQPPGASGPAPQQAGMGMMGGMMAMGGIPGMPAMGGMNVGGMGVPSQDINQEYSHIPVMDLASLKRDLGVGDRGELNMNDKARMVSGWRSRNAAAPGQQQQQRKDSAPGMLPPQQQVQVTQQQQQQQRAGPQQPQMQPGVPPPNRMKRNSSSPGNENDTLPRTESSPPERKRIKRESPVIPPSPYPQHLPSQQPPSGAPGPVPPGTAQSLAPQQGPMQPQTQQPGQLAPGASQHMMAQQNHLMFIRHQMAMNANGPNPGGQGPPNPSVQAVMGMQMHPGQMQPPQQPTLFRLGAPPGSSGPPAAPAGPPPGFSATPLIRLGQPTKPSAVGMGPTPSPGMNGLKDAVKDNKPNGQPQVQQGPASPRNATAPPTPGVSTQTPGLQQPPPGGTVSGSAPQTSGPASQPPPGVNSMLGMPMDMPGMNAGDLSVFDSGFIAGMEFGPGTDTFEREFGQWFNTTEDGSGLDT